MVSVLEKIIVFKTSADKTIRRLFQELGEKEIDCFIQSSQMKCYQSEYPYINFIDICRESFYHLPSDLMEQMSSKSYDSLYITVTGVNAYCYENIIELADKIQCRHTYFYNCNGDRVEIPKKNIIKDTFCRLYIKWIDFIYSIKRRVMACAE